MESLVFLGSGPVAAESLRALTGSFEIEAIITKPATVEEMGGAWKNCHVYAVSQQQQLDDLITSNPFSSKLAVLVDFGIIVSRAAIDYFPLGIVNSHFSLLPEWRGADPISFSLLSGQKVTGVSLMLLTEKMDEGNLLGQGKLIITPDDTGPSLTNRLITLSAKMLKSYLPSYINGQFVPYLQNTEGVSYSRKLTKADGVIDWHKSAIQIEREIRAFTGWPKSHTTLGNVDVIITQAHAVLSTTPEPPGHIEIREPEGTLMINTASGYLRIDHLKPAGKNELTAAEFIRGYRARLLV